MIVVHALPAVAGKFLDVYRETAPATSRRCLGWFCTGAACLPDFVSAHHLGLPSEGSTDDVAHVSIVCIWRLLQKTIRLADPTEVDQCVPVSCTANDDRVIGHDLQSGKRTADFAGPSAVCSAYIRLQPKITETANKQYR
jgi:hypothetical protein